MLTHQKVVWAEGILLGQQHFQHWDRYLHSQQQAFQQHALPFYWGVVTLDMDEAVLAQGVIRVNQCVALLKNRRWIYFNSAWDEALVRMVPDHLPQTLDLFLALPDTEYVSGISGYPEMSQRSAWEGEYHTLKDSYDPLREREVLLAKPSVRLLLEGESVEGLSTIQIARLEFNPLQSAYRISKQYSPPVLNMGGCPYLMRQASEWSACVTQHVRLLEAQKDKHRHVNNQFGYGDFIYFNLIKTLTTTLFKLQALQALPQRHPVDFYDQAVALLSELAGYLPTPWELPPLPAYRHDALAEVFSGLKQRLDDWMQRVLPTGSLDVMLHRVHETHYESEVLQPVDLRDKQFCLALYHEECSPALVDSILAQVKVSSPSRLMGIVQSFTQGVGLSYQSSPGKTLMAKRNYHYFTLDKQGEGWESIVAEGRISFFISKALAGYPFELICY